MTQQKTAANSTRPMMPNDALKMTRDYAEPLQSLDDPATLTDKIMAGITCAALFGVVFWICWEWAL